MKIVIADDHALFADGLKNLLETRDYQIVGSARDGLEAFEMARRFRPDIMLIDIFMPKCDGLEATSLIASSFPEIKIVILTSSENENDVFNAVKVGACGYFIKSFESDKLFEVLEALENDEIPVSPGLAGKILSDLMSGKINVNDQNALTDRQREVLSLVAQGKFYKDIAEKLGISERTVKYHVKTSIDKLHLQNRNQLINFASRTNMIERLSDDKNN